MQRREPERTCIACRKKASKENFIKLVLSKDGQIHIEKEKKLDGRGIYLCKNPECIKLCIKNHSINRVLKRNVDESIIKELSDEITN